MNPWMRYAWFFILSNSFCSIDVLNEAAEVKKEGDEQKIKSESWEHANKKEKLKTDVKKLNFKD